VRAATIAITASAPQTSAIPAMPPKIPAITSSGTAIPIDPDQLLLVVAPALQLGVVLREPLLELHDERVGDLVFVVGAELPPRFHRMTELVPRHEIAHAEILRPAAASRNLL